MGKYEREAVERRHKDLHAKRSMFGLQEWEGRELDELERRLADQPVPLPAIQPELLERA